MQVKNTNDVLLFSHMPLMISLFFFVLSLYVEVTITLLNFIELMCYVLLKDLNLFEVCSCRFFFFLPYYILLDNIDIAVVDFWGSMTFITFSNHINDNVLSQF